VNGERRRRSLDGAQVDTATWGTGDTTIVLLHDGLGSIDQWRGLPADLATSLDATVVAYDRVGHGSSTPLPVGPWPVDWMHTEARRLIDLVDLLGWGDPIFVGHSDGGSIALLAASIAPTRPRAVVALAAHSYVEDVCVDAITAMRQQRERFVGGLSRFHRSPEAVFDAWSGAWVSSAFRSWDIRDQLGAIEAPTLIIQGDEDEYGTTAMATDTAAAVGESGCRCVLLPGVGHLVHHQAPSAIVELVEGHLGPLG